ncbi:MAG: hypothetical protein ABR881_31375 [Candidatus Sulfotelmatobacter sp.]|jgi:hypothetical protein
MKLHTIGIDLGKTVVHLVGLNLGAFGAPLIGDGSCGTSLPTIHPENRLLP